MADYAVRCLECGATLRADARRGQQPGEPEVQGEGPQIRLTCPRCGRVNFWRDSVLARSRDVKGK